MGNPDHAWRTTSTGWFSSRLRPCSTATRGSAISGGRPRSTTRRCSRARWWTSTATRTDYAYDPLGNLRAFSRYRVDPNGAIVAGDRPLDPAAPPPALSFAALQSADPALGAIAAMLGQASGMYFYDPLAWHREGEPAYAASVRRERYLSDGSPTTALQIELEYTDGLGRSVQQKQRAEGGPALTVRDDGTAGDLPSASVRWLTSGRTVYNSKGLVVKQYEPFYADTPRYQPERAITERGVQQCAPTTRSGAPCAWICRPAFFRMEFEAWRTLDFDANDTDARGPYVDTPTEQWLDVWGRAFLIVEHQRPRTPPDSWQAAWSTFFADKGISTVAGPLRTYSRLDINGNPTGIKDARLFGQELHVEQRQLELRDQLRYARPADPPDRRRQRRALDAVQRLGRRIQRWDARGIRISTSPTRSAGRSASSRLIWQLPPSGARPSKSTTASMKMPPIPSSCAARLWPTTTAPG